MEDDKATLGELRTLVREFVREREWEVYHRPKNLAGSIAIEAAELLELFQWQDPDTGAIIGDEEALAKVEDECADVLIYLIALANVLELDLSDAIRRKVERNRKRFPVGTRF